MESTSNDKSYATFHVFQLESTRIPGFFDSREYGDPVTLPLFTTETSIGGRALKAQWSVVFDFQYSVTLKACVTLVSIENSPAGSVEAECQFDVNDSNGDLILKTKHLNVYDLDKNRTSSAINILSYDNILRLEKNPFHDGVLVVCCCIGIKVEDLAIDEKFDNLRMAPGFRGILNDGILSDVVLEVEGRHFPAHKVILATASPVLRDMISTSVRHATSAGDLTGNDLIQLNGISIPAMENLLEFIYTDDIAGPISCALDLMKTAEIFKLDQLMDLCERRIKLDLENFADVLIYADRLPPRSLRKRTLDFIEQKLALVKTTETWLNLVKERPDLVADLVQKLAAQPPTPEGGWAQQEPFGEVPQTLKIQQ